MTSDHETLKRIWLGNETEKFGTKWVLRLQPLSGLAGAPRFCHSNAHTRVCLWHGRKQGRRKERKREIQKWKGRSAFTRWLLKWEHPAPPREAQSLFSRHQELRTVLGKHPASAEPGFQQNQQQSSPDFKGNWIRPMSRAFQRLILKSVVLITLPEGKQRVRSVYPCRHWRPQLKGLNLDEPHKWSCPLNKLNFAQFLILGKFRVWEESGSRETHEERLLRDSNVRESWERSLQPFQGAGSSPRNKKSSREKSLKSSLSWQDLLRFNSHWRPFPSAGHTPVPGAAPCDTSRERCVKCSQQEGDSGVQWRGCTHLAFLFE